MSDMHLLYILGADENSTVALRWQVLQRSRGYIYGVPLVGLEPTQISPWLFESHVSTISPQRRVLI